MPNESDRTWPSWDSISTSYKKSFANFRREVYEAGGEIWSDALRYAKRFNSDESTAYHAMMNAIGSVSQYWSPEIRSLQSYLFTTYKRRLFDEIRKTNPELRNESLSEAETLHSDPTSLLERTILLKEIVSRMDSETLKIYEGLILGYTYEEMAKKFGKPANVLRSRFSKRVHQIASDLNLGPVKLTK